MAIANLIKAPQKEDGRWWRDDCALFSHRPSDIDDQFRYHLDTSHRHAKLSHQSHWHLWEKFLPHCLTPWRTTISHRVPWIILEQFARYENIECWGNSDEFIVRRFKRDFKVPWKCVHVLTKVIAEGSTRSFAKSWKGVLFTYFLVKDH